MIAGKYITRAAALMMAGAFIVCLCSVLFSGHIASASESFGLEMEYESRLFDRDSPLEINIIIGEDEWQSLLDNAINEEYVQCDVEIAGETLYRVGIRPKGNTSLSSIAMDPETDRYSLKLEFDKYVDGQSCFGLDKLILNNSYADATYMKEALIYDMFLELGADASLYNYARLSVNGEYRGLYLALEAVEDSFMLRNYGAAKGQLYKPDSMDMGGGRGGMPGMGGMDLGNMPKAEDGKLQAPDKGRMPDMENFAPPETGFSWGGMMGGGGGNLNYSGDAPDNYSTIWNGAVTESGDSDHRRVVTALRNISEGNELEKYMDTDNLIKYMAVHIFSVNDDSLSGSMAHNYYLYERGGQLNILPWDYNLAFGGMGMGRSSGATDVVNGAIDDAWNSTGFFDTLLQDDEYHAAYYSAMGQLVDYVQNGDFEKFYEQTRDKIDSLVEADPTAFYSYEEYLSAAETLYEVVKLRAGSIQGQLDGSIPSTESGQRGSSAIVDASHIDLSVLGSMDMGGEDFKPGPTDDMPGEMEAGEFTRQDSRSPDMMQGSYNDTAKTKAALLIYTVSAIVMAAAVLFALKYKRRCR